MKIRRETSATIADLLIALKQEVIRNRATFGDTELLVQTIMRYLTCTNEITLKKRLEALRKIRNEHLHLCAFFIDTYKKIKPENLLSLDYENFVKYLLTTLIQPMILTLANTTKINFISPYFGNIPVINLSIEQNHSCHELTKLDLYFQKESKNTADNLPSPLLLYLQAFRLLNKDNHSPSTPITDNNLFHYLMNFYENKNENNQVKSPRILFASADVLDMFQTPAYLHKPLESITLKQEKIILVSIDRKLPFNKILHNIFQEFQQIFNSYFIHHTNPFIGFTKYHIETFIQFIASLPFTNTVFADISIDMHKILTQLQEVTTDNLPLDTWSSLLTPLLFTHSDIHIREFIKKIFFTIETASPPPRQHDLCLNLCNALSNAFFYIEHTLQLLSQCLCQFNANFISEFIRLNFANITHSNDLKSLLSTALTNHSNHQSWPEIMQENNQILAEAKKLVTDNNHSDFCCFSQIKKGNYKQLMILLYLGKQHINKQDTAGYSLLAYSVINNHLTTYKLLLEFGADIHWRGNSQLKNYTLLHLAASFGSFELIPTLITQNLSVFDKDSDNNTPLLLLTNYLSYADNCSVVTEKLASKTIYKSSIKALATLLAYSGDEPTKNTFYLSLITFRKNIALLKLLNTQVDIKNTIPKNIIHQINTQFSDHIPCIAYKNCYQDLSQFFYEHETLFYPFIRMGIRSVYTDLLPKSTDNNGFFNNLFSTRSSTPPPSITYKNPLSEQEQSHLLRFYAPRNILAGVSSMVAVTLAQRTTVKRSNSMEKRFQDRKLLIDSWKKKVENHEDEGLVQALLDICSVLNIKEINHEVYHKLSTMLHHLIVILGNTLSNSDPCLFKTTLIHNYRECENRDHASIPGQ